MSTTITERIRLLRESTGLGRTLFAREIGMKERTLISIEREGKKPGAEILAAMAEKYPQYMIWLLTGKTDAKAGHISPQVDKETQHLGVGSPAGKSQRK